MPRELNNSDPNFAAEFAALVDSKRAVESDVDVAVAVIVDRVRRDGDTALLDYTKRFDGIDLSADKLRVTKDEIDKAYVACDSRAIKALELAASRIEEYHLRQLPEDALYKDESGITLGSRWTPIQAAGLYVPGGTAAYPSSVLMNAIPAKVAGVKRLVMAVPSPQGKLNPLVLAAANIAGVSEIYRVGGAQAVAALAFGTKTIAPVDKIVGPGNAYVAAAKRRVFGTVGIDMVAGPSEILVVADGDNDPAWIAADLLSQAEHDKLAQSILITTDARLGRAVMQAVESALKTMPRAEIARASWNHYGAVIVIESLDDAVELVDRLAPEHLELAVANPEPLARRISNAGAIFLGRYTPEAIGDYVGGPNHVLPTSGSARFSSGLGVLDFMKRTSWLSCDAEGLRQIGPAAVTLAKAEGLDGHARSISIRLNLPE